ncbi:MAG TPA: hypothetical protein PKM41_13185 [Deltaproteobacteria bacterium]|jgi:predicted nuclease with TOPRIM domain|nr:hypothetical protein [Deltaproteobacteria bacterium]
MRRALSARGACFLSLFLFILLFQLEGCTASLYDRRLRPAELELASGKQAGDKLKGSTAAVVPPSVAARKIIAQAMDIVISEKYNENDAGEIRRSLLLIRKDPLVPHDQKVEAGYLTVLFDKIETLKHQNKALTGQKEKCLLEADQLKAENDKLKKDLEELRYKLQKIEEIHITTEKKRGVQ